MNLLTPTGYKNINDVNIGDELIAYDINTGDVILNTLLKKELWTHDMYPANPPLYNSVYNEETQEYEDVLVYEGMDSEQVFNETQGEWKFYEINGTWKLYKNQSIWANMKTVHVTDLQIGDIIYDDQDNDVEITSIVECTETSWWRLEVSNDHSYISENLQLHNASRYWSGNMTPTSFNWNFTTGGTNWGSASGVADNATVPTSVDDVIFDGAGVKGNANSIISAAIGILSITFNSGYTGVVTINSNVTLIVAGNFTDNTAHTWVTNSGSSLNISAASIMTSNGRSFPGNVTFSGTNTKTLVGNWTILSGLTIPSNNISTVNYTSSTDTINTNGFSATGNGFIGGNITLNITGGPVNTINGGFLGITVLFNGNINFTGGNLQFGQGVTLKYVSGVLSNTSGTSLLNTAIAVGSTSGTLELFPYSFNNGQFGTPLILNSTLLINGSITPNAFGNLNFQGSAGFECGTLSGFNSCIFKNGITYVVKSSLNTSSILNTIASDSATLRANLILINGATCITRFNFTRINATGGRTINSWNGTITNCLNVRSYTDFQGVSNSISN